MKKAAEKKRLEELLAKKKGNVKIVTPHRKKAPVNNKNAADMWDSGQILNSAIANFTHQDPVIFQMKLEAAIGDILRQLETLAKERDVAVPRMNGTYSKLAFIPTFTSTQKYQKWVNDSCNLRIWPVHTTMGFQKLLENYWVWTSFAA